MNVSNVRTSRSRLRRSAPVVRTHATTVRLCTSRPAHRSTITSIARPPLLDVDARRGSVRANISKRVLHVLEAQSQLPAGPRRHGVTRAAPHQSPCRRLPNPPTTSSPQLRESTPIAGTTELSGRTTPSARGRVNRYQHAAVPARSRSVSTPPGGRGAVQRDVIHSR